MRRCSASAVTTPFNDCTSPACGHACEAPSNCMECGARQPRFAQQARSSLRGTPILARVRRAGDVGSGATRYSSRKPSSAIVDRRSGPRSTMQPASSLASRRWPCAEITLQLAHASLVSHGASARHLLVRFARSEGFARPGSGATRLPGKSVAARLFRTSKLVPKRSFADAKKSGRASLVVGRPTQRLPNQLLFERLCRSAEIKRH